MGVDTDKAHRYDLDNFDNKLYDLPAWLDTHSDINNENGSSDNNPNDMFENAYENIQQYDHSIIHFDENDLASFPSYAFSEHGILSIDDESTSERLEYPFSGIEEYLFNVSNVKEVTELST